jgi:hypothetical protein
VVLFKAGEVPEDALVLIELSGVKFVHPEEPVKESLYLKGWRSDALPESALQEAF